MTLTNFLCSRIVSFFKSVSSFCSLREVLSISYRRQRMFLACVRHGLIWLTVLNKILLHIKEKDYLFKKFLMASFISKIFSLFKTYMHNRVELKTAGSSHNELCTVLTK